MSTGIGVVRGNTQFCNLVHSIGSNLDFRDFVVGRMDRGVKALVAVRFRRGNVIFDSSGKRLPVFMDRAERRVAVGKILYDDADRNQVINPIQIHVMFEEFSVKAEIMFCP